MKLYCELCKKVQPVRIDNCRDAKTNEPYQDIVCAECDFVIASGTDIAQPEQRGHCTCGNPEALGMVHFRTRPCIHYTAPYQWIELTKQDVLDALGVLDAEEAVFRIAKAIEMKSKEKNGG